MGLFPQTFLDDLRMQVDILQIVQETVALRRAGSSYKGLCPFHPEKTPSFTVHPDRGFFHCFGCGTGGDVFKFVELRDRLTFPEAVRSLAQRAGLRVPEPETAPEDRARAEERESLVKVHEIAAAYFQAELMAESGARARGLLRERRMTTGTARLLGIGYAPPSREGLVRRLQREKFDPQLLLRSGLVVERGPGRLVDRFWHRLMFPICRESGAIVAFGGRALEPDQQPKYLNSPETSLYTKSRILYGLHLTRSAIREQGQAVLVEGYFDFAQAFQAGVKTVVASCGTALTPGQVQLLKRHATRIVLNFDQDAAGQGAAMRSCDLLVTEGFDVNVAILPEAGDPDTFIRTRGGEAYSEQLRASQSYLEFLIDRVARESDFSSDAGRRGFLSRMLGVAARIPDPAMRDQFADRLAHRARISEPVVRAEIRKAAVARQTTVALALPAVGDLKPAEQALLWALEKQTAAALEALAELDDDDLEGLATASIWAIVRAVRELPAAQALVAAKERLSEGELDLLRRAGAATAAPAPAAECVRALKRLRYERERAAVQDQIARLLEDGSRGGDIEALWVRKIDLSHRIEALNT